MAIRKNSRNMPEKKVPWGPMLLGFLVGAFVMFLLHLKDNVPEDKVFEKPSQQTTGKKAAEPTFDFYTLLPEMEVVVDDKPKKTVVTATTKTSVNKPQQSFMIQVGSFKKMSDADAFKASLALLGIESKVQTVTIDNKQTWHRVQVGPIAGRDKADNIQKQLKQNGFNSLLMRARHG